MWFVLSSFKPPNNLIKKKSFLASLTLCQVSQQEEEKVLHPTWRQIWLSQRALEGAADFRAFARTPTGTNRTRAALGSWV